VRSDALCGNLLAALTLRGSASAAPSALVFHPSGRAGAGVAARLVYPGHGEADADAFRLAAEASLGTLPLRQLALAPGTCAGGLHRSEASLLLLDVLTCRFCTQMSGQGGLGHRCHRWRREALTAFTS
jgi:hypothetical protein